MEAINRSLYFMINVGDHPSVAAVAVAMFLAQVLIVIVPLLIIGLWLWGGEQGRKASLTSFFCLILAIACNVLIGKFTMHPRPFMIPLGHTLLSHRADTSFPSDHAAVFFSVGLGLYFSAQRRLGALLVVLGVAVGGARVYLGVHFPFDIIGALLVAIASVWGVIALLAHNNLQARIMAPIERWYLAWFALPISWGWLRG